MNEDHKGRLPGQPTSDAAPLHRIGNAEEQLEAPLAQYPYSTQMLSAIYSASTGRFTLERASVMLNGAGVKNAGNDHGISDVLDESQTMLVDRGFVSKSVGFVVLGLGFQAVGPVYLPTSTTGSDVTRAVSVAGVIPSGFSRLRERFLHSAFDNAILTFYRDNSNANRRCVEMIGKPEFYPSGMGYNEEHGLGVPVIAQCRALRRAIAIPPGKNDNDRRVFTLDMNRNSSFEAPRGIPALADNTIVALRLRTIFFGYYAEVDEDGSTEGVAHSTEDDATKATLAETLSLV